AGSYASLGEVLRLTGRMGEAQVAYQQALEIQQRLGAEFPEKSDGRPEYRQEMARTHYNLGILCNDTQRPREAETAFNEALNLLSKLATEYPKNPVCQQHLARAYLNLGPVLRASGRTKEAEETYLRAL